MPTINTARERPHHRLRRYDAWHKPIPRPGSPAHRALVGHSLDVYGRDLARRFALTSAEWRSIVRGLLGHCRRYGITPPDWLASYDATNDPAHG